MGPTHVFRFDRGEGAAVVEAQPHAAQLSPHIRDVLFGRDARVLARLHGILFGGKPECVIAHGVQDVLALHAMVSAHHIGGQISQRMTDM